MQNKNRRRGTPPDALADSRMTTESRRMVIMNQFHDFYKHYLSARFRVSQRKYDNFAAFLCFSRIKASALINPGFRPLGWLAGSLRNHRLSDVKRSFRQYDNCGWISERLTGLAGSPMCLGHIGVYYA